MLVQAEVITAEVSILARSGDRALPHDQRRQTIAAAFQSSPGLVTGRYQEAQAIGIIKQSFNPRPVW